MSDVPSLTVIKAKAKRQGFRVRRSGSGSHLFWLVDRADRIASPERGVTQAQLWQIVSLPEEDPRAKAVWENPG